MTPRKFQRSGSPGRYAHLVTTNGGGGWLVLTRREGELIQIGSPDDPRGMIWVKVIDVSRGGLVRIGIDAPRDIAVVRVKSLDDY